MIIRSRRRRWFAAFTTGFLLVCVLLAFSHRGLTVVLYNNTDDDFQRATVSVGAENIDIPALHARESMALRFHSVSGSADVKLFIDTDPPFQWSAPAYASGSLSGITLRVDAGREVTITPEETWARRLSRLLD